ncbi:MAG: aminopeptidase [Oligoflexia bacterium]|nr:aminopeptidase [Oligoflexia bacterium]
MIIKRTKPSSQKSSEKLSEKKLEKLLEKYAELILKNGVHVIKGQSIIIKSEPIHWPFINILIKKAYQLGAKQVVPELVHPYASIYQTLYQKKEYLGKLPRYTKNIVDTYIDEHWARIMITGSENPNFYSIANQDNNTIIQKELMTTMRPLLQASIKGDCTWTIAPYPTPKWAQKVLAPRFGKTKIAKMSDEQLIQEFWKVLIPILRLNHKDPSKAWKKHSDTLKKRVKYLNSLDIEYLHYESKSGKTDLKIYLADNAIWGGGNFNAFDKRPFLPNIPTEEVFSCPHRLKTEGSVKVTRPVKVFGDEIIDAYFEFKDGRVVNYSAKKNKALLDKYFSIDENARYLGEVALVDSTSPIYQAHLLFDSILLDENASCHIALGNGIPSVIKEGTKLKEKDLKEKGCNHSLLHTDFMIGSDDLKITAYIKTSKKNRPRKQLVIMKNGKFSF